MKNFNLLISTLLLLLFYPIGSNVIAGELSDDCMTFNLSASCNPPKPPAPPKPTRNNYIKDEVLVIYPSNEASKIISLVEKYNLKPMDKVILSSVKTGLLVAKTNGKDPLRLSKTINNKEKNIEAATNNIFKLASITTNSSNQAYSLRETGVNVAHNTTKGEGVTICMVDTPVDINHPTFSNSHIDTLDLIKLDTSNLETMIHGTSVAGVLVSQNELIGVAPKAKLLAISAFIRTKKRPFRLQGSSANIAKAIDRCIQHKVDVINLSFTGGKDSLVETLIKKAVNKGIIVTAAGGNGGHWGSSIYPALISGVLTATAVDNRKMLFSMADKGSFIDYATPGVNILTTAPGGTYTIATGTSLSSAHLSGIVALLLSQTHKHNRAVNSTLTNTAIDLGKPGRDQEFGDGLVNANRALSTLKRINY